MSRADVRQARCVLCGAPCDGRTCRAHDGIEVDAVPADPLESLPMQAAETQGEDTEDEDIASLEQWAADLRKIGANYAASVVEQQIKRQRASQATNGTEPC